MVLRNHSLLPKVLLGNMHLQPKVVWHHSKVWVLVSTLRMEIHQGLPLMDKEQLTSNGSVTHAKRSLNESRLNNGPRGALNPPDHHYLALA